jgi:hypothetical protein
MLSDDHWLTHTWSKDGSRIFGIRETEQMRLSLVSLDARTGEGRVVADFGPSPPVNNPVKGLSMSADGRTVVTSIVRLRGGLWRIGDISAARSPSGWLSLFRFR